MDKQLQLIADYLEENPQMRSLVIAQNLFNNKGMKYLINSLRENPVARERTYSSATRDARGGGE